ncbi:MAG: hypothetical protein NTZ97_00725 [Candidatus Moranbacteria bacterium]|nr:hypothetical protein [Candidatus Moranbacteria bacterium]
MKKIKKVVRRIITAVLLFSPLSALAQITIGGGNDNGGGWLGIGGGGGGGWFGGGGYGGGGWQLGNYTGTGLPGGSIYAIIYQATMWFLALFGFFGIIGFVISGIIYLTSGGDEDLIERGKRGMKWSIIGVVVGLIGYVILQAASYALSGMTATY